MPRILVIDDDELSREILLMLLDADGYTTTSAASGDEAIAIPPTDIDIILTDMQMPGLCGNPLAQRLRQLHGPDVRLIAMSGSEVDPSERSDFDHFLLKPFTVQDLEALLSNQPIATQQIETPILDQATYAKLQAAMTPKQVHEMLEFCLADAEKRLTRMAEAVLKNDDTLYRREAHTIKGGCGMIGALELREIAGTMESQGLAGDGSEIANILNRFTDAAARLRRIL